MPETKVIPTITELFLSGTHIDIKTSYLDLSTLPDTLSAFISETVGSQDMTPYIEGELIIQMKNHPQHLTYLLDSQGHLILVISTGDGSKYSINDNGHLIYTT